MVEHWYPLRIVDHGPPAIAATGLTDTSCPTSACDTDRLAEASDYSRPVATLQ